MLHGEYLEARSNGVALRARRSLMFRQNTGSGHNFTVLGQICTKISTHMYLSKTNKKVSWTHWLNSTGSRVTSILCSYCWICCAVGSATLPSCGVKRQLPCIRSSHRQIINLFYIDNMLLWYITLMFPHKIHYDIWHIIHIYILKLLYFGIHCPIFTKLQK